MTLPLGAALPGQPSTGEPAAGPSLGATGQIVRGSLSYFGGQVVTLLTALVAAPSSSACSARRGTASWRS